MDTHDIDIDIDCMQSSELILVKTRQTDQDSPHGAAPGIDCMHDLWRAGRDAEPGAERGQGLGTSGGKLAKSSRALRVCTRVLSRAGVAQRRRSEVGRPEHTEWALHRPEHTASGLLYAKGLLYSL